MDEIDFINRCGDHSSRELEKIKSSAYLEYFQPDFDEYPLRRESIFLQIRLANEGEVQAP